MKAIDIFNGVAPNTVLYKCGAGMLMKCRYVLTEVETGYYGERTYRIVLEDVLGTTRSTWVDRSGDEWFLTLEEAVSFAKKRCESRIKELKSFIWAYDNML